MGLLSWQWAGYPDTHRSRANLLLHLGTIPLFWAGTVLLVVGLLRLSWTVVMVAVACLVVPVLAQGFGHKQLEAQAPAPFTSPWDFIARLVLEQWITFPRYVLSGGLWDAFRTS